MNCESEMFYSMCPNVAQVTTSLNYIGPICLCFQCYKEYYSRGFVEQPISLKPIQVDDLKVLLNFYAPRYSKEWRGYYDVYDIRVGTPVSSLLRSLLVQYQNQHLSYYEVCKIVEPIDSQLQHSDWLTTDNGTTFTRTFQP